MSRAYCRFHVRPTAVCASFRWTEARPRCRRLYPGEVIPRQPHSLPVPLL